MSEFVEPRVRRVVADRLGVELEELAPDVSLIDDLAADSLGYGGAEWWCRRRSSYGLSLVTRCGGAITAG